MFGLGKLGLPTDTALREAQIALGYGITPDSAALEKWRLIHELDAARAELEDERNRAAITSLEEELAEVREETARLRGQRRLRELDEFSEAFWTDVEDSSRR